MSHEEMSRGGRAWIAKKCTQKRAARAKLLFCFLNLFVLRSSLPSLSSFLLLKLSNDLFSRRVSLTIAQLASEHRSLHSQ